MGGDPERWTAAPGLIDGITDAVDLTSSFASTCALRATGEVVCFGENEYGQLGRFSSEDLSRRFQDDARPGPVSGLKDVERLGTAIRTSCAAAGGERWCWGAGNDCLLGDSSPEPSPVPLRLGRLRPFTKLDGGDRHLVAVIDGRLHGWGSDAEGALNGISACSPTDLGLDDVVDVAAGSSHSCALLRDGQLRCFGRDLEGQLGGGEAAPLPGPAAEVRAAFDFTCARLTDGPITCFGLNEAGLLGTDRLDPDPAGSAIPDSEGASTFDVGGGGFGCFIRGDGTWCWGRNALGTLGSPRAAEAPRRVHDGPFVRVEVSPLTLCALREDGQLHCWGDNQQGQLGRGERTRYGTPGRFQGEPYVDVAVEGHRTCALDPEGRVWCAGRGRARPEVVEGFPPTRSLSASWGATCALTQDDEVWCFGNNEAGVAAPDLPNAHLAAPRRVPGLTDVEDLTLGGTIACARQRDGRALCWGEGHPDGPTERFARTDEIAPAVQHICARQDNEVYCVGNNQYGQLGDGTARSATEPVRVHSINDAAQVSTDFFHTCVRSTDGKTQCFGQDLHQGRLGQGPTDDSPHPRTVDAPPAGRPGSRARRRLRNRPPRRPMVLGLGRQRPRHGNPALRPAPSADRRAPKRPLSPVGSSRARLQHASHPPLNPPTNHSTPAPCPARCTKHSSSSSAPSRKRFGRCSPSSTTRGRPLCANVAETVIAEELV